MQARVDDDIQAVRQTYGRGPGRTAVPFPVARSSPNADRVSAGRVLVELIAQGVGEALGGGELLA